MERLASPWHRGLDKDKYLYTASRVFAITTAMTSRIVKIAAVQAAPVSFDLKASLAKLSELTVRAASSGADLVVFP